MSREYSSAGAAVDAVGRGQTYKAYCAKNRMGKIDFALASETLKYKSVLSKVMREAKVSAESLDVGSQGMVEVMVYELLVGDKKIRGGGAVKRRLLDHLEPLTKSLAKEINITKGAKTIVDLLPEHIRLAQLLPQYLRINPLQLTKKGLSESSVEQEIRAQCPGATADKDIPHLWALPLRSPSFGQHERVKDGCLIIQDKASCFPSQLLVDAWKGGDVIDACAAPGNKTSHMAAVMHEKSSTGGTESMKAGTIYAFDKNPRRAELLKGRMESAGATGIVTPQEGDFLALDVHDKRYKNVCSVLLDPSCSGSGVARDLSRHNDESEGDRSERLDKLRTFQVQALRKAMSFPAVKLVLYSTCSIHEEENESVVAEALLHEGKGKNGWDVHAPARLQHWPRRGHAFAGLSSSQSAALIRCHPQDGLNGFFVAEFRKGETHVKADITYSAADDDDAVTAVAVCEAAARKKAKREKQRENAVIPQTLSASVTKEFTKHQPQKAGCGEREGADEKHEQEKKEEEEEEEEEEEWTAIMPPGMHLDDLEGAVEGEVGFWGAETAAGFSRKRKRGLWRPLHLRKGPHQ